MRLLKLACYFDMLLILHDIPNLSFYAACYGQDQASRNAIEDTCRKEGKDHNTFYGQQNWFEMLLLIVNLFSLWFFFIPRKLYCLVNYDAGTGSTKRSGYVHVATPYPSSKQVKKIPSIIDNSKRATGYSCKSCSK